MFNNPNCISVFQYFSKNQKDCMPCLAVNFFNYENCHIISIRNAQIRISRSVNKTFHKQIQTRPRTYCKWIHFFLSFVRMYFFFIWLILFTHLFNFVLIIDYATIVPPFFNINKFKSIPLFAYCVRLIFHLKRNKWNKHNMKLREKKEVKFAPSKLWQTTQTQFRSKRQKKRFKSSNIKKKDEIDFFYWNFRWTKTPSLSKPIIIISLDQFFCSFFWTELSSFFNLSWFSIPLFFRSKILVYFFFFFFRVHDA